MISRFLPLRPIGRFAAGLACVLLLVAGAARAQNGDQAAEPYRLGEGDEITVSVSPQKDYDCGGTVGPDGKLNLKNIGEIRAAGMTLEQLREHIFKVLSRELKNPTVVVQLVKRGKVPVTPKVTVTGAVVNPGALDLEEGLRLRRAIDLAGGFARDADLTRVTVTRKDLKRVVLDLSDPDRVQDPQTNLLLQPGDSVEVPLKAKRITVGGAVARPGPLDLEEGLRLRKAIDLAGGPLKEADLTRVLVIHRDLSKTEVDLSTLAAVQDPNRNVLLREGDSVEVPIFIRQVSITGAVANPGTYELKPGWALEDLIGAAGKLTVLANVERLQLKRRGTVREINLVQQQRLGVDGRILLEPGDEVFVPDYKNTVIVVGAIPNPGYRPITPGQKLSEFLKQAGPETLAAFNSLQAEPRKAQIIRQNQEPIPVDLKQVLADEKSKGNIALQSGDVLYIPAKDQPKRNWFDYLRTFTPLGGLIGLILR